MFPTYYPQPPHGDEDSEKRYLEAQEEKRQRDLESITRDKDFTTKLCNSLQDFLVAAYPHATPQAQVLSQDLEAWLNNGVDEQIADLEAQTFTPFPRYIPNIDDVLKRRADVEQAIHEHRDQLEHLEDIACREGKDSPMYAAMAMGVPMIRQMLSNAEREAEMLDSTIETINKSKSSDASTEPNS